MTDPHTAKMPWTRPELSNLLGVLDEVAASSGPGSDGNTSATSGALV
ncbi:MAG: hypothetical protein V4647_11325 [Pseudomonadota bacterium]